VARPAQSPDRRLQVRRQATVGPYIVDFLCVEARLVIELDGGQHHEMRDAPRTAFIEARGYEVQRFWNSDVIENLEGVLEAVRALLLKRADRGED
jgi:very-short-patch-repair endonuclease